MINAFKAARLTNQTLSGVGSTLTYAGQGLVPYAGATGTVNLNNQILTGVNSIGVNGNVMPTTNAAYSLGTPLMAWSSAYIGNLGNVNGSK